MKRIILAGGSGFVGRALAPVLVAKGYDVVVLSRGAAHLEDGVVHLQWDGRTIGDWAREIDNAEAIVNLTGKNINCRHNAENRREIVRSRVDSVRVLGEAVAASAQPPKAFVQASGIGYYGDTGDRLVDETGPLGNDFSADVCRQWEDAFETLDPPATRKVVLRLGVVLGRSGGALPVLEKLTRFFLGGVVGSGRQFISWIHVADIVRMFVTAIDQSEITGVFNATAPAPVTNREFMGDLRHVLHRPWSPPVPAPLVRAGAWIMGSEGDLALVSSRCAPRRFLEHRFSFQFPNLRDALAGLYHTP